MALRFYAPFYARDEPFSTRWRIEIYDEDFVGTAEEFDMDIGQTLRWSADSEERHAPIRGSELSFSMNVDTADQQQLIYDIQSSREGRFTVRLKKSLAGDRFWAGVILPDISSYQDREKTVYKLSATDGIAALRKIEYRPTSSTFYSGKASFVEHILNCLNKLPYITTHWTNTEEFLYTAVDWWETTMTRADGNDPLADAYVDHANYYRFEKGDQKALSCLEVLEDICKAFGCFIRQADGVFIVEQVSYRQAGYVTRNYDYQGNYITFTTNSAINSVVNTSPGTVLYWKSFLNYDYYPGLLKAIVNFETYQRRNYIVGATLDQDNTSFSAAYPMYKATDGTVLHFRLPIRYRILNVGYAGGNYTPVFIKFSGTLRLVASPPTNSKYWRRQSYIGATTYQISYLIGPQGEWVGNSTSPNAFEIYGIVGGIPPVGVATSNVLILDQDLPPMIEDAVSYELTLDYVEILDGAGTAFPDQTDFDVSWYVEDPYLGTYTDGIATTVNDTEEYSINNVETDYSEILETSVTVGTTTNLNTIGAIFVDDGAGGYDLGGYWGNGTDPADQQIGIILGQAILSGQLRPIKKANGVVRGLFNVRRLFEWESDGVTVNYLFHSGEWLLDYNELSGLFHEVNYGGTFTTTPIKRKKKLIVDPNGNTTFPPTQGGGNANNQPGLVVNNNVPPGTTLTPMNDATTDGELLAGAQTSIPVYVPLEAGQFWIGDIIRITNPLTGTYEQLTVTASSEDSDTAIAVSGTTQDNYPPYSTITIRRRVGRNHLPIGLNDGDLLRYDSTNRRYVTVSIGDLFNLVFPTCISDEDAVDNFGVPVGGWYIAAQGHFGVKPGTLTSVTPS
jgi:hypothetical protein